MRGWRLYLAVTLCAALGMWGALRTERLFTQAWNDYHDFQIMRAWIAQQQQAQAHPPVSR